MSSKIRVILVVEDEWLLRLAIVEALREHGWSVLETSSGEGALGYLRNGEQISLVVTDIQLSGDLDGWEMAAAFRDHSSDLPIIYASGTPRQLDREVPGSVFLKKPLHMDALLGACQKLLAA